MKRRVFISADPIGLPIVTYTAVERENSHDSAQGPRTILGFLFLGVLLFDIIIIYNVTSEKVLDSSRGAQIGFLLLFSILIMGYCVVKILELQGYYFKNPVYFLVRHKIEFARTSLKLNADYDLLLKHTIDGKIHNLLP